MTDRFGLLFDSSLQEELLRRPDEVDFLEIVPDRYFGGADVRDVGNVLAAVPNVFHSLNLSLGSEEPLDGAYLMDLSDLAREFKPMWASDHLAFTRIGGVHLGQLAPIRWSAAAAARIAEKVRVVQDELGIPFLLENIAYYFRIPGSELPEGALLEEIVAKTGCGLLLDLNNVVVNAANHKFDPLEYLAGFPLAAVREVHIAGHRKRGDTYIDSHSDPVGEQVWRLLQFVASRLSSINVLLERDQEIPPLNQLVAELKIARRHVQAGRARPNQPRSVPA